MKQQIILLLTIIFFTANSGFRLEPQGLTVSGILDSTVAFRAGAGDDPAFSYGFEEYANIRFQTKLRDKGAVFGAVNFIAAAGDYAAAGAGLLTPGQNYAAAIELERLYFRLNGEAVSFDGGLLRLPFGYGQVWGPSDFLNPKNPLKPDARPRAVLGAGLSWYPADELKLLGFCAAPRTALGREGEGWLTGVSLDQHWEKASLQFLYSFESPQNDSNQGMHRAGMSVKADLKIGLVTDLLYTYNHEAKTRLDGLSYSIGFDYSFFDGNLIVLAEYLYNGATSSTSAGHGGIFSNENYLSTSFTWRFSDYTNATVALISSFNDVSFMPIISLSHDLFQGAALNFSAQVPLDRDLFSGDGNRGELGPLPPDELQLLLPIRMGRYFNCSVSLKLRF
jgi:hypothetical protein